MKSIPEGILSGIYREWDALPHRERKTFLEQRAQSVCGCSVDTLYRAIRKIKNGQRPARRADHGRPRVTDAETIREDMMKISAFINGSAVGRSNVCLSVEEAIDFAYDQGYLHQKYAITTARRYLNQMGITRKRIVTPVASIEVNVEHSNDVWYVDATPANQIFLRPKTGTLKRDGSYYEDRSHAHDRLQRDFLDKIWIYCAVDGASRAYYAKAYAGLHLGENALHWIEFLSEVMTAKTNGNPVHGRPKIIYSDKGSGLTSGDMLRFCTFLEIETQTHLPGNPRAKGKVEARIGAIKRRIETLMALCRFETIEQFNSVLQARVHLDNQRKGHYDSWLSKLDGPVRLCSRENCIHAQEKPYTRKINGKGCVSIDSELWFVDWDMVGRTVDVHRTIGGVMIAEDIDGHIYQCSKGPVSVTFGSYHGAPVSEMRARQAEAVLEGKRLRQIVTPQELTPPATNIAHITPKTGEKLEKTGRVPLESYDNAEMAWMYVAYETGIAPADLPEEIRSAVDDVFDSHIRLHGHIDRQILLSITSKVKKEARDVAAN